MTWNDPGGVPADYDALYAKMASSPASSRLLVNDGNVDKALAGAAKVVEATYYYPYQLHGSMGPSCAIADVKGDEATVWSPTQGVYPLRTAVARLLGFRTARCTSIYKEGSGCYGLNGADTASIDAVLMSKAVGAPVRVQWMRSDEHVWEHYGTPMILKARGGLDADGNLIAWDYESLQAGRGGRPGNVGAANLPTGALIGLTLAADAAERAHLPAARRGQLEHGRRLPAGGGGHRPERPRDRADGRLAVLHRPAPLAGADPEHLRERVLHRRARGGGGGRPRHVQAPLRRRRAAPARDRGGRQGGRLAAAQLAEAGLEGRHRHRPRVRRDAVRGRGRLRGNRGRDRGEQEHGQDPRDARRRLARRRDHHEPARAQGADRGERRPRRLPRAQGGGRARTRRPPRAGTGRATRCSASPSSRR